MWNPNIWEEAKKAGTTFKPWQSWNPKWRPKKWINLLNQQLKDMWYKKITHHDITETYLQLMNLTEVEIKKLLEDKTVPYSARQILKHMVWKDSFNVIEKMLDRWVWKPKQSLEHSWKVELPTNPLEDRLKDLWLS